MKRKSRLRIPLSTLPLRSPPQQEEVISSLMPIDISGVSEPPTPMTLKHVYIACLLHLRACEKLSTSGVEWTRRDSTRDQYRM